MCTRSMHRLITDTEFVSKNIVSYGLIVYAQDTQHWLIIQRKHSVDFILFFKGAYRPVHLPFIFSNITPAEADIIRNCIQRGPEYFSNIYLNELGFAPIGLDYARVRMAESVNIVKHLLVTLNISDNDLAWTWPKGRLSYDTGKESPLECAFREFDEEVEIKLPEPVYISSSCFNEILKTRDCRNVECRYWVYVIAHEIPLTPPQAHPEVADRRWVDLAECRRLLTHTLALDDAVHQIKNI